MKADLREIFSEYFECDSDTALITLHDAIDALENAMSKADIKRVRIDIQIKIEDPEQD